MAIITKLTKSQKIPHSFCHAEFCFKFYQILKYQNLKSVAP